MTSAPEHTSTIVFLCVANSSRSQMAEGFARANAPSGWRIYSAGTRPNMVHPLAIMVMREIGIDISDHRSKGIQDVPIDDAGFVVTLCSEEICPAISAGAQHLHWPLPDPATSGDMIRYQLDAFRSVRDDIKSKLDAFWDSQLAKR